jgi:hypothetical protein
MCGEGRREAFGTCVRVAGSFVSVAGPAISLGATVLSCRLLAVNPDLSPLGGCRVGQEEGGAGLECKACPPIGPGREVRPRMWKVSLAAFYLQSTISNFMLLETVFEQA